MAHSVLVCSTLAGAAAAFATIRPYAGLSRAPSDAFVKMFEPSESAMRLLRGAAATTRGDGAPYCKPGDTCWPTAAEWRALNASVGGALIQVAPPLVHCFPPFAPGDPQCAAAINNFTSSYWRASLPGAMQSPNLEQDPVSGEDCFDAAKPCRLGAIPPYAVAVGSEADVAAALAFAAAHGLRVVVKSSGHEYQGRSTAADALLLWMHALAGIAVDEAFAACPGDAPRAAVTTRPGSSWGEVYDALAPLPYTVVGGSERSVSSCGGYSLGGGHSWQGPAYGMAADNALRFTVVLANGSAVTASACENADLFWALRGGGGGSFAVATSATYALHAVPAEGVAGITIVGNLLRGPQSMAATINAWLYVTPALASPATTGVVAGGYYFFNAQDSTFKAILCFNGTVAQANASLAPIAAWVAANPLDFQLVTADLAPFPSLAAWHASWDPTAEPTGSVATLGSRLIPLALMADETRREALAFNLTSIAQYVQIEGLMVAGGAVAAADPGGALTAVSPAWRAAGVHLVIGAGWALNATLADQASVLAGVGSLTGLLRDGTPDGGAYFSESDPLEPAWQDAFWGSAAYARLQAVKAAYDPDGVFTCHHCVELPQL